MDGTIPAYFTIPVPCSWPIDLTAEWSRQIPVNGGLVKMAPCRIAMACYLCGRMWTWNTDHIEQDYFGFRLFIPLVSGD